MRIVTWRKYEGEGIPNTEWQLIDGITYIKINDITHADNSKEATNIRHKIGISLNVRLTDIKCKECGAFMEKYPLQSHPKANRLGWKFRYICSNNDCLYEYYTKEDECIPNMKT